MGRRAIGEVEDQPLILRRNADTAFSVEWWAETNMTGPIAIASAEGQVRDSDLEEAELVLDLDPFITVSGNVVWVQVPWSAVVDLPAMEGGWWDLIVTSATDERRAVLEGTAAIRRGATR